MFRRSPLLIRTMQSFSWKRPCCSALPPLSRRLTNKPRVLKCSNVHVNKMQDMQISVDSIWLLCLVRCRKCFITYWINITATFFENSSTRRFMVESVNSFDERRSTEIKRSRIVFKLLQPNISSHLHGNQKPPIFYAPSTFFRLHWRVIYTDSCLNHINVPWYICF